MTLSLCSFIPELLLPVPKELPSLMHRLFSSSPNVTFIRFTGLWKSCQRRMTFSRLNSIKTHRVSSTEKKKSFIMTAQTTTLKLKTRMISEDTEYQKNIVLIPLSRWDYSWMRMEFPCPSLFLAEMKTSSLPCPL